MSYSTQAVLPATYNNYRLFKRPKDSGVSPESSIYAGGAFLDIDPVTNQHPILLQTASIPQAAKTAAAFRTALEPAPAATSSA